jgi:putative ABC transport system permease protein
MEESIVASLIETSGVDEETIRSYLSEMSDEELYASVRENMTKAIAEQYRLGVEAQLSAQFTAEQLAAMLVEPTMGLLPNMDEAAKAEFCDAYLPPELSEGTYEDNIKLLNAVDLDEPSSINIYATTFEAKDEIAKIIAEYNKNVPEEDQISYTDFVAMLMSSVTTVINAISTVLIAFVSISLVVSSIMIGIITYISVLERTKEIGILRAIGASKKDISRVFNAEAFVIGLASGLLGIGVTALLCIPANIIIKHLTDIANVAKLPVAGAVILVVISVILTVIAGFVPSKIAAKKDPVIALRSE